MVTLGAHLRYLRQITRIRAGSGSWQQAIWTRFPKLQTAQNGVTCAPAIRAHGDLRAASTSARNGELEAPKRKEGYTLLETYELLTAKDENYKFSTAWHTWQMFVALLPVAAMFLMAQTVRAYHPEFAHKDKHKKEKRSDKKLPAATSAAATPCSAAPSSAADSPKVDPALIQRVANIEATLEDLKGLLAKQVTPQAPQAQALPTEAAGDGEDTSGTASNLHSNSTVSPRGVGHEHQVPSSIAHPVGLSAKQSFLPASGPPVESTVAPSAQVARQSAGRLHELVHIWKKLVRREG